MDSWENEIIVRASKTSSCWYGVLDSRGEKHCSLDFATGAETREDAIRFTALKIRLDVLGIGKYAPHDQLKHRWDMEEFWGKKEVQRRYRQKKKAEAA